jgi:hypothetical protein
MEYSLCKKGHVRSPENVTTQRQCRVCHNEKIRLNYVKEVRKQRYIISVARRINKIQSRDVVECKNGHDLTTVDAIYKNGACRKCCLIHNKLYHYKNYMEISKVYIKSLINIPSSLMTDELHAIKRATLLLRREYYEKCNNNNRFNQGSPC